MVKLLNATELKFRTGEGMPTLGHLREAVTRELLLPPPFQRYAAAGRSYHEDTPDGTSLEVVLRGTKEGWHDGEWYERVVFLLWMANTDFICVGRRGGMFLESELEQKKAWVEQQSGSGSLEYITLRRYLLLDGVLRNRWSQYRKRNKERTGPGVAIERAELGLRALSSDSEEEEEG